MAHVRSPQEQARHDILEDGGEIIHQSTEKIWVEDDVDGTFARGVVIIPSGMWTHCWLALEEYRMGFLPDQRTYGAGKLVGMLSVINNVSIHDAERAVKEMGSMSEELARKELAKWIPVGTD